MPDQANGSRPPRMHGITHVDIPAAVSAGGRADVKRTPNHDFNCRRLYAHQSDLLLCSLPSFPGAIRIREWQAFLPHTLRLGSACFHESSGLLRIYPAKRREHYVQALPILFLLSPFFAGFWHSSCGRCQPSGAGQPCSGHSIRCVTTVRFLVLDSIVRSSVAINFPPMPAQYKLAVLISIAWNLLILCYLAFYPGVKEAFERGY